MNWPGQTCFMQRARILSQCVTRHVRHKCKYLQKRCPFLQLLPEFLSRLSLWKLQNNLYRSEPSPSEQTGEHQHPHSRYINQRQACSENQMSIYKLQNTKITLVTENYKTRNLESRDTLASGVLIPYHLVFKSFHIYKALTFTNTIFYHFGTARCKQNLHDQRTWNLSWNPQFRVRFTLMLEFTGICFC